MAFSHSELIAIVREVKLFVDSIRPPQHRRHEMDIVYAITGQAIDIVRKWSVLHGDSADTNTARLIRLRYVRSVPCWYLYRVKKDGNWHLYDTTTTLNEALIIIGRLPFSFIL